MPDLEAVLELLASDPVLGYSLLTAILLASISLGSGWARLDFLGALRPTALLHITLAVLIAIGLLILSQSLRVQLADSTSALLAGLAVGDYWPLTGLSRFPLYVIALAYGPSAGLIAAALFAAFGAQAAAPSWPELVLGLELAILGWFALYPSAFLHRWAGPANAAAAYLLAWCTGGVAFLQGTLGEVTWAAFWEVQRPLLAGVGATALLLATLGPQTYRSWFRLSRIAPPPPRRRRDDPISVQDLPGPRQREYLLPPPLPELRRVRKRKRPLTPPTFDE